MRFSVLQDEVYIGLKDASSEVLDRIPSMINQARNEISAEVELPALRVLSSLSTVVSQAWVALPAGNAQRLLFVGTSSGRISIVEGGLINLLSVYPMLDSVGDVEYVALEGSVLYYQGIPATATPLVVYYTTFPTPMSTEADQPTELPEPLQRGLILHKTLELFYDELEEGMEDGLKPNKAVHELEYKKYKTRLEEWAAKRRNHTITSCWSV